MRKKKKAVVDDSAFMRKVIGDIIDSDSQLNWPVRSKREDALLKKNLLKPDVMTLDVEMPKLNGLETLRRLMETEPLPVIMVSSHTKKGSEITLEALSAGAVDFVAKPSLFKGESAEELKVMLPQKIKAAAGARLYSRLVTTESSAGLDAEKVFPEVPDKRNLNSAADHALCCSHRRLHRRPRPGGYFS